MDRKLFLKSLIATVPMLYAGKTLAYDEQGGENALNDELGKLQFDADFESWITVPGANGQTFKVKPLTDRYKEMSTDVSAVLVRLEEGYVVGPHMHPEGEFTYIISGGFIQDTEKPLTQQKHYEKGDFLWMAPGTVHGQAISKGVTLLSMKPKKVVPI